MICGKQSRTSGRNLKYGRRWKARTIALLDNLHRRKRLGYLLQVFKH